jgi:MFS transporter, AAHS family, 4-hydroxybenzoate transporter
VNSLTSGIPLENSRDESRRPPSRQIDVGTIIDGSRVGSLQRVVLALCGAIILLDGFDVQLISFVAPVLLNTLHIERSMLGPVFAAGSLGTMLGAFIFAPFADRLGRKKILCICVAFFALCSLGTITSTTVQALCVWRFLGGLGLGGATPIATALAAEYCPRRSRSALVMVMYCGFSVGAAGGGLLSAYVLPDFGWKSLFILGGVAPLMLLVAIWKWLPESVGLLVIRGGHTETVKRLLRRIEPGVSLEGNVTFAYEKSAPKGFPLRNLFQQGMAMRTLTLWVMFFSNILSLYFLVAWFPTLIHALGISLQKAVLSSALIQVGSIVGTLLLATIVNKLGAFRLLAIGYAGGAASLLLLSHAGASPLMLPVLALVAGFFVIGTQTAANALSSVVYPTSMRSTGIGWALGVGRIGSFCGPALGGALLSMKWPVDKLFLFSAGPALIAATAAFVMWTLQRRSTETSA